MALNNPYQAYRTNQVFTLSREKLVLMMYDGGLRFCRQGLTALKDRDYGRANENLIRAQEILAELMAGLNFEAGEVARQLYRLYEFMHWYLVQANINKKADMVEEVIELLQGLRDAWEEAVKKGQSRSSDTQAGNLNLQG
ncbi:flagellar export chaperone FliS [Thermanaeromonas sp. C210]|uniref:flagellar export chaperone FliS n=1 Tax=Thermanaeromonas sp. C210 TaxID=2731925 RepID=UPI00155C9490|nr:flagellar export chaperone FliS [Thermanaeromonas sp. C210]GFN24157.1 flagellar protein FliS [Thermanaeromonas sp. C210]